MSTYNDWNQQVIDEFRANDGQVGGEFEDASLLLLHHVGAKTGTERVTPLMYQPVGDSYAVFASMAGAPINPAWFHNLVANPVISVEVGPASVEVNARVAAADERTEIWEHQKATVPQFADYEANTSREIPVVILDPRS